MKKIYLVDVSSLFFRAFYAIRPLSSPNGVPVNAIYGLLSMMVKLFKSERPEYMVVCYDRKEPSFRKEIYDEYKANRSEMPEELVAQIPYMKKLIDFLGIPSLEIPRFEADDLIGTLTRIASDKKMEVVIVSGDKDFAQLIKPGVIMYDTMKESRIDENAVLEKWGVQATQFCDYLSIVGDSSDNIPGVAGLGPKGAQKLLNDYKTLENIYDHLDEIKPAGAQEKLRKAKDMAFLSKKLVCIDQNVPVEENVENYRLNGMKKDELRAFLQDLNFKSFEKNLLGDDFSAKPNEEQKEIDSLKVTVEPAQVIGFENNSTPVKVVSSKDFLTEVKNLNEIWAWSQPQGVFFSDEKNIWSVEGDLNFVQAELEKLKIKWLGFDLKNFWRDHKGFNPEIKWDSMLAAYVVRAGDCSDIYKVFEQQCGEHLPELAGPGDFLKAHLQLKSCLEDKIKELKNDNIYKEMDLPFSPILLRMESRGIKIDLDFLKSFSDELAQEIAKVEKEILELAGENFNVASPKQLAVILFDKLKLPVAKKTKTGYSTDNEVLQELDHPIAHRVLEFRELSKLKSTYVDALPLLAGAEDHRVHTHFNQALTTTGRLSSTQPNLQNIPIRTERGARVREAFIAEKGFQLLSVDYSQIELRILAHISEDPGLVKAFKDDLDIHTATASEVFGVKLAEVTSEQRRKAKAVNFGIAYGQGAFGLADVLGIPRGEAKEIIERYFTRFKGIKTYIDETIKFAYEKGYVETLFGRRRYLDELKGKNAMLKKFGERAAINAPIQGTAADLVKKAMIQLDQECPVPMLLQVHDELVFEAKPEVLEEWKPRIVKIMENIVQLRVPLKVNTK
jgi:DNA polymerase I